MSMEPETDLYAFDGPQPGPKTDRDKCPSCGVPYVSHLGLIETCRELTIVDKKLQKYEEGFNKLLEWRIHAEIERDRYKEALEKIKKMDTHICGDLKLIAINALRGDK